MENKTPQLNANEISESREGTSEEKLAAAQAAHGASLRSSAGLWVRDIVLATCAAIFIIIFLYQPVRVEGTSMLPRLEDRDRVFVNKFAYNFVAIQRGDVVVFHYPRDPELSYIKRIIGTPGDRVRISHGMVYVNDKQLNEPYVPEIYKDNGSMPEVIVPPNHYFVMGDHRNVSSDSRSFGTVDRSFIYGKASLIYWPARDFRVVE